MCLGIHDCQTAEEEAEAEKEKMDSEGGEECAEEVVSEDSTREAVPTPPDSPRIILSSSEMMKDPRQLLHPYTVFSGDGEHHFLL